MSVTTFNVKMDEMANTFIVQGETIRFKYFVTSGTFTFGQVESVIIKNDNLMGKRIIKLKYRNDKGKLKTTPQVQMDPSHEELKRFEAFLKETFPGKITEKDSAADKTHIDMLFNTFLVGRGGMGLPRTALLLVYLFVGIICLVLPAIYIIMIMAKGGWRVYLKDDGADFRKFGSFDVKWSDLKGYSLKQINWVIRDQSGVDRNTEYRFTLTANDGRTRKFAMRSIEGERMLEVLAENGVQKLD
jgi:hypothetical protein